MDEPAEKLTSGEPLSVEQLIEYLPALKEVPAVQLEKYAKGAAVLHRYRKGETVCTEGEFGSSAFFLEKGKVKVGVVSKSSLVVSATVIVPSAHSTTGRLIVLGWASITRFAPAASAG